MWLAPPLKSASVESGSEIGEAESGDSNEGADTVMKQINRKLKEANEVEAEADKGGPAGFPKKGPEASGDGPGQEKAGQADEKGLSAEQRKKMAEQLQNMTPEERQKLMKRMQDAGGGPGGGAKGPGVGQRARRPRPQGDGGGR